jgi:hypothetical protein
LPERFHGKEGVSGSRWHEMVGNPGGSGGIDDAFAQRFVPGIGGEIMGANKFGHPGWHEAEALETAREAADSRTCASAAAPA